MNTQQLWQSQALDAPRVSLAFVRHQADALRRRTRRNNANYYIVSVAGLTYFGWKCAESFSVEPLLAAATALWIAAGLICLVLMRKRIASQEQPAEIGGERGIRTLEGLLALTPLAGVRLRPLGHLSGGRNHKEPGEAGKNSARRAEPQAGRTFRGERSGSSCGSCPIRRAAAALDALEDFFAMNSHVFGALMPMRTWLPFTPRTVTVTSSPMTTDSPTRLVKISILRALRRASLFINSCRSDPRKCGEQRCGTLTPCLPVVT